MTPPNFRAASIILSDPIGKKIHVTNGPVTFREIVGIVGDVKHYGLDSESPAQTYEPYTQQPATYMVIVIRCLGDPASLGGAVRAQVLAIDKEQPVASIRPLEEILRTSVSRQRFAAVLLGIFACLALILAAVGIYGVMAYSVSQRTHEMGIRMALGAQQRDVLRLVIGQGMLTALVGLALGIGAALALTRAISSLLFNVQATDPVIFASVTLLLAGIAFAACYVPARRAIRVDPIVALRYE